jgi:hypothetical protein
LPPHPQEVWSGRYPSSTRASLAAKCLIIIVIIIIIKLLFFGHFLLAVKIILFLQLGIILNNEGSVVEDFFQIFWHGSR